jgi:short-subunit dehydrogenase involved in D-alanine esterification of teichoic acids
LAGRLVDEGSHVIALGRRQEHLDALIARKGSRVEGVQFDVTKLDQVPGLADRLTGAHPDIDCIILNSGIQRKCDFSDPGSIDMDLINLEFVTNYLSYLALTKAFLPFLMAKPTETSLIYVSSNLALIPIPRVSNYCATKAALHQWILCLREQLSGSKIKVVEIFPPAVQTELHDEKHQPDLKNGRAMGMPLDQFTNEVTKQCPQRQRAVTFC